VLRWVALRGNEPGQRCRQLMIHQKLHTACNTRWSVWWAAYSMAARMSSR
jgi:hypothetical protein